jgi:hypothetical protein
MVGRAKKKITDQKCKYSFFFSNLTPKLISPPPTPKPTHSEPHGTHESNSTTSAVEGNGCGNSTPTKESPLSHALNPAMVEIPAEFSKVSEQQQQHISPAVTETSTAVVVGAENNEVATTSVTAMNTNDDDDELNQLLENLDKFDEGDGVVVNNLHDSDLQDLLKFD